MRIDVRNMQPDEKIKVRFGEVNTIHGKDGKSAYDYAVDGGYTGTEEEFAQQLANGGTGGIAKETDPTVPEWAKQYEKPTYTAAEVGAYTKAETDEVIAQATLSGEQGEDGESAYEIAVRLGFEGSEPEWLESLKGDTGEPGKDGKSAYDYAVDGGYTGTEEEFSAKLAETEGVYELISCITLEGGESAVDITEDNNKNSFALRAAYVKVEMPASNDSGTGYIETYYGDQRISKHHLSNMKQSASAAKTAKAEVVQRHGRWAEYTYGSAAEGATSNMLNIVQFVLEANTSDLKYIDKVRVRVTGGITFDVGTKITVEGVRA